MLEFQSAADETTESRRTEIEEIVVRVRKLALALWPHATVCSLWPLPFGSAVPNGILIV